MRGKGEQQTSMLVLMNPEELISADHPLRQLRSLSETVFHRLSPVFDAMYSSVGRPSIPPERLLGASLLMALYSVKSERAFCERLKTDLLFKWFLGMTMVEAPFEHSTFSANRQRLLDHEVAGLFFQEVVSLARSRQLMSSEHFTVDGSLIDAWASLKSFRPKSGKDKDDPPPPAAPGDSGVNLKGSKLRNATHSSATDPEARLYRKSSGKGATLCFCLNALTENRHGLLVNVRVGEATGTIEREAALAMVAESVPGEGRITVGADKGYNCKAFVAGCRALNATPHVPHRTRRHGGSAIDGRTSRHEGYLVSLTKRKLVEQVFGWMKTVAGFARTRFIGVRKTQAWAYLVGSAYNLLRISKLQVDPA